MKKFLRPPEHWQDFENLCKKLFGEMLSCPHTIKKNGRLGQAQSGVDVYGKPKGESFYWGIQCKGKDNFSNAGLSKKEIDEEISKARTFLPALRIFAFATTAAKDVAIEEYIRLKDAESTAAGGFEILLFDWPDLSDLIEEHRDTYNYYVNNIQFKDQYEVTVTFEEGQTIQTVNPTFLKTITTYELVDAETLAMHNRTQKLMPAWMIAPPAPLLGSKKINHAWFSFTTIIFNTGSRVLEDWKFYLYFPDQIKSLRDDFTHSMFNYAELSKYRTAWADEEGKFILYKPSNNHPLIQRDRKSFLTKCLPLIDGPNKLKLKWKLLARDYNQEGELTITIHPHYEIVKDRLPVTSASEVRTEEKTDYYITDSK